MRIIEIKPLNNGAHSNTNVFSETPPKLPDGWAAIPDNMECKNYPFGEVVAEEIKGVMTVTKWIPGVMPEVPDFKL